MKNDWLGINVNFVCLGHLLYDFGSYCFDHSDHLQDKH